MARRTGLTISALLAFLGYTGAAVFYAGLIGFDLGNEWVCPVCLHVTSFGDPLTKFVRRVIGIGTVNALLFICAGWLLIALYRTARWLISKSATAQVR